MSEVQTSNGKRRLYGVYTLVSLVALIAFLMFAPQWCWLTFPFLLTYLVLALDAM